MNKENSRYDLSLYTRDPWVYIGFNNFQQASESVEENAKSKTKEFNNIQANKFVELNTIVGKKRISSSAIIEIKKVDSKKSKLDFDGSEKSQTNETKTKMEKNEKKSHFTQINSKVQNSMKTIETIKSPRKIIPIDKERNVIPKNSLTDISTKPTTSKNFFLENEIFNTGMDIDFKPKKKDEVILKLAMEKFYSNYLQFLNDLRFLSITKRIERQIFLKNSFKLFNLYKFVKDNGGIENGNNFKIILVIGYNLLSKFISESKLYAEISEAKHDYDHFLYNYSLFIDCKGKLTDEIVNEICEKDSSVLIDCPIITAYEGDSEDVLNKKIKESLKYDLVILRGFFKNFNLNNSIFSIDYLEKNCNSKNQIDVIEQDKNFFGFIPNRHTRRRNYMRDYIKYVRSQEEQKESGNQSSNSSILKDSQKHKGSSKERLLYGVNIELSEYMTLYNELECKIHPLLLFGSSYDSLAYVRNHIKGMTIPQMYIKVPGVWTGGHEENLRMRSINICHGPGASYWWASPTEHSKKLVEKVQEEYNLNIYKKEGIWFPNVEFFLKNRIKVHYTVQEAGDIVLVGPGTIHWVRARDHSINTSWNFSAKEVFDLKCSMERNEINKEIKIRSLVPMKTLILDILNSEMFKLNVNYVKACSDYLIPTISESITSSNSVKEEFQKSNGKYNIGIFKEDELYMVENCEVCLNEIFNLWAFCEVCSKAKEQYIVCLNCFRSHLKQCYNPKMQFIFYKYEANDLQRFIERLNFRLKFDNQMESKELIEPQKALQKNTKDTKSIAEKMKFKIIETEDYIHLQNFYYLYKNIETNQISSLLVPLIDPEKFSSEDFRTPLKSSNENFLDPYIDFDDLYYEESNKQRFSPSYKLNSFKENNDLNNRNCLVDDYLLNESNTNILEINSIFGKPYSLNNSIKMSPKISQRNCVNNISYPAKNNFNSNLPGKAFFDEVEESEALEIRSYRGLTKIDLMSQNKFITPSSPKGSSNIFSLVSDIQSMKKLKNDLNAFNSQPFENGINHVEKQLFENEGNFCVMDMFNGIFSSSNKNEERKNSDQKKTSLEEIKIAKSLLSDLTGKEAVSKYKFISKIHSNIWKGMEIISRYAENKEVCELTNLKPFVEKIISNSFLITAYRDKFKNEIYDKMK